MQSKSMEIDNVFQKDERSERQLGDGKNFNKTIKVTPKLYEKSIV